MNWSRVVTAVRVLDVKVIGVAVMAMVSAGCSSQTTSDAAKPASRLAPASTKGTSAPLDVQLICFEVPWTVCSGSGVSARDEPLPEGALAISEMFDRPSDQLKVDPIIATCGEFFDEQELINEVATTTRAMEVNESLRVSCGLVEMVHTTKLAATSFVDAVDVVVEPWVLPLSIAASDEYGVGDFCAAEGSAPAETIGDFRQHGWVWRNGAEHSVTLYFGCGTPPQDDNDVEPFRNAPSLTVIDVGRGDIDGDGLTDVVVTWRADGGGSGGEAGIAWLTRRSENGPLEVTQWEPPSS
jgi:hypothetical protein